MARIWTHSPCLSAQRSQQATPRGQVGWADREPLGLLHDVPPPWRQEPEAAASVKGPILFLRLAKATCWLMVLTHPSHEVTGVTQNVRGWVRHLRLTGDPSGQVG